jgi:hypothetical protein
MRATGPASVFASVGMDVDVPVEVRLAARGMESVEINIGYAPEVVLDLADVASLERLRDAAAEGARLLAERIKENRSPAARERAARLVRMASTT